MKRFTHHPDGDDRDGNQVMLRFQQRRGSTLIVVLALLAALMLLGFLVLSISTDENLVAGYFSDAAKVREEADLDTDAMFNFALRQLILGPYPNNYNSALYKGRFSLVPNLLGNDIHPYNGQGVNLMWDGGAGLARVDIDYDEVADVDQSLLDFNTSPAVLGSVADMNGYPAPDVGMTVPDLNNLFLSYEATVPDGSGGTVKVRIPSFDRPQYLRNVATPATWHSAAATVGRLLRPHELHNAYPDNWDEITASVTPRFVLNAADATALGLNAPFPFATLQQGVWTGDGATGVGTVDNYNSYSLQADPDGDGVLDAVYIDLGFPMQQTLSGTEFFVPMPAFKIIDADALFNLNVHGNLAGDLNMTLGNFGNNDLVSQSNQGVSPSEVNPQYGLYAAPIPASVDFAGDATALSTALEQHRLFFGNDPANALELANMELWFGMQGRAEFSGGDTISDVIELFAGRHGELNQLTSAIRTVSATPHVATDFSFAGTTGSDDNGDEQESGAYVDSLGSLFPNFVTFPAFQHPLDLYGSGDYLETGNFGKDRALQAVGAHRFARYDDYSVHPQVGYLLADGSLMPGVVGRTQLDDEHETLIEPAEAQQQPDDEIFEPRESPALHLHANDIASTGTSNRLRDLFPFNFQESLREREIREQFTTTSWDPIAFSKSFYRDPSGTADAFRDWEFNVNMGGGTFAFPPEFATSAAGDPTDPFRPELRELLMVQAGDRSAKKPQRRMSINGLLDRGLDGRLRFRPLTPHPTGLSNSVVASSTVRPESITDAEDQEWLARYDRQRMCRDIYVLLYTLCGGDDLKDYTTTNAAENLYGTSDMATNGDQTRRLAQLAVNWVDRLDGDDTITLFEYDIDLSDGWNLDDNPYDDSGEPVTVRGLVYGVEAQKIAFSEALVLLCQKYLEDPDGGGPMPSQAKDHDGTNIDDFLSRDFTFLELENVSPYDFEFGDEVWQVAVKAADTASQIYITEERRLTLSGDSSMVSTGANSRFTLGTTGDPDTIVDPMDGGALRVPGVDPILPTRFGVRPLYGDPTEVIDGMGSEWQQIVTAGTLNLDLMKESLKYRVNIDTSTVGTGVTVGISNSTIEPAGRDLLHLTTDPVALAAIVDDTVARVRFELRRRANLNRERPNWSDTKNNTYENQSADNPWVVVDYIDVPVKVFQLPDPTPEDVTAPEIIRVALGDTVSSERYQPLDGHQLIGAGKLPEFTPPAVVGDPTNSLGNTNNASITLPFTLWQSHPDRDFSSIVELFDLPLYGPAELTRSLGRAIDISDPEETEAPEAPSLDDTATAGSLMLTPEHADNFQIRKDNFINSTANPVDADKDNRWYRLLSFVEVPSRLHRETQKQWYTTDAGGIAADPFWLYRVPGKIQLNTLRHPSVLTGLLDDLNVVNFFPSTRQVLDLEDATRDWYLQFLAARDGVDPLNPGEDLDFDGMLDPGEDLNGNGLLDPPLYIPGLPTGRPFRELGFSLRGAASIEDTILRTLKIDNEDRNANFVLDAGEDINFDGSLDIGEDKNGNLIFDVSDDDVNANTTLEIDQPNRRLLELGTRADQAALAAHAVDHTSRYRLLQKLVNNSTTRSNVFIVFVQIDFFEAKEVTDTGGTGQSVVRIGGKRADSPGYRSFFVIDRSKALELLEPQHIPDVATTKSYSFDKVNDSFIHSVILHRQTIE